MPDRRQIQIPNEDGHEHRSEDLRTIMWRFELEDLSFVLSSADDLVGVLFRVVKSQAADREIGEFIIAPRSHPR